jgi:hypothetical protein
MLTRKSVFWIPMLDLEWSGSPSIAIPRHGRNQPVRGGTAGAMRILKFSAYLSLAVAICSFSAHAQQVAHLRCQGVLFGSQAVIDGTREYATYNALGDGQVRFAGTVAAAGLTGEMHYAGYTATAPFRGVMSGPLGAMEIGVLDNTGGRMIIYNGRATLGPPDTIGQLVCAWG